MFDITGTTGVFDPVTGTDNKSPVINLFALHHMWALDEIYIGEQGEDRFVPRVNDTAIDYSTGDVYGVTGIDPVTKVSSLEIISKSHLGLTRTQEHLILQEDPMSFRLHIDTSVTPYSGAVNRRLVMPGEQVRYMVLKYNGKSISKVFDTGGTFISDQVPLSPITNFNNNNAYEALSVPNTFSLTEELIDGNVVQAYFYDDTNSVIARYPLIVEKTQHTNISYGLTKTVQSLEFISPYITTPDKLCKPKALLLKDMNLKAKISYTDGSARTLDLAHSSIKILGADAIDNVAPNGTTINTVLRYTLQTSERWELTPGTYSTTPYVTKDYSFVISDSC